MSETGPSLPPEQDPRVQNALLRQQIEDLVVGRKMMREDLTEAHEQRERAENIDSLTGVGTRAAFEGVAKRLDEEYAISGEAASAIVAADLDNIKLINDTFGHAAGNDHLIDFADALEEAGVIEQDGRTVHIVSKRLIFRLGEKADEFVVIVPTEEADSYLERAKSVFRAKVQRHNRSVPLPTEFTAAAAPIEGDTVAALEQADQELLRLKAARPETEVYRRTS